MKIKVQDLKPNPFRNIKHYPINTEKVELLKASIKETDFWDNLLARKKHKHFELAYGHHRLTALKELGIEEIDIPVRNLDDATMIKIMANENLQEWQHNTAVVNETVLAAKTFLDRELAKYETWEEFKQSQVNKSISLTEPNFHQCRKRGVGQTTILKFLGEAWKQYQIQRALAILNDEEVARESVEIFDNPIHSETYRELCKKQTNRISSENMAHLTHPDLMFKTKEEQLEAATAIKERLVESEIEITKNTIQAEFKRIVNEKKAITDEDLISEMTDEDLVNDYIDGKVEDLRGLLGSFLRRLKRLKKEIAENEPTYKKTLLSETVFYPIIKTLKEVTHESGCSLTQLIEEYERKEL